MRTSVLEKPGKKIRKFSEKLLIGQKTWNGKHLTLHEKELPKRHEENSQFKPYKKSHTTGTLS